MNIFINEPDTGLHIRYPNKLLWEIYLKKIGILTLIIFLIGLYILITGLREGHDNSTSTTNYIENERTEITNTTQYNYHMNVGIGVAIIVISFYNVLILFKQRRQQNKIVNKICKRHETRKEYYSLKLNEDGCFYQDFELTRDEKWTVFSKYKVYKNYLFIFRDYPFSGAAVPINLILLSNNEKTEIMTFVKSKFTEKR